MNAPVKKKGMLFDRMWLPNKLTIEAERIGEDIWQITYTEILPKEVPTEDIRLTVETVKLAGVVATVDHNMLQYKMTGTRNQVFGIILGLKLLIFYGS